MTTATHESDPIAPSTTADPIASVVADATEPALAAAPSSESERSLQIVIQTIASRILGAALLERAQEADSFAT